MASESESVEEYEDDEVSRRNLVVKLVKLEDQLGLTRWTTWSEVKMEPVDDYDDYDDASNNNVMGDGGMEWLPIKEEPPDPMEEAGAFTHSHTHIIPNGTVGGGEGSKGRQSSSSSSPATCVLLSTLGPMDEAVSSRGDYTGSASLTTTTIVTASPEETHVNNTTTTTTTTTTTSTSSSSSFSQAPPPTATAQSSPATKRSVGVGVNGVPPPPPPPAVLSSPHLPTLEALNLQSPQVIFVGTLNKAGGHSGIMVPVVSATQEEEDPALDLMDIASSQLTPVDEQAARGLGDLVAAATTSAAAAAAASSSSHTSPPKLATKRADRHRKGGGGQNAEPKPKPKPSGRKKEPPTMAKKTRRRKKREKQQSSSSSSKNGGGGKNHAIAKLARDSNGGSSGGGGGGVMDNKKRMKIEDSADIVMSTPSSALPRQRKRKKKRYLAEPEDEEDPTPPTAAAAGGGEDSDDSATGKKDKGMFPMHPTLGKRVQSGTSTAFNLFRLALLLPNEDAAVEFAQHFHLLPRFRHCPLCRLRLDKLYRIVRAGKRPLFRFQCNKQPCKLGRNQVPLRWGTKYVSSNLSLRKAIILDYCFVKKYDIPTAKSESAMPESEGSPSSERMVSTSTETVVDYYNHSREVCAFSLMRLPPVGGLGYTVELYESFFVGSKSHNQGGSKSHKVHAFQGQYVLAGVCIENNDVVFAVAPDLEPGTLLPLLQTKVALGTHVRTSSCPAYAQLWRFGYEHTVVKDTQLFVHNDTNFSGCSNVSQAGTMRPLTFHRRSGTFNLHLAEYLWRRKHREAGDLFVAYLEAVASVYPVTGPVAEIQADGD